MTLYLKPQTVNGLRLRYRIQILAISYRPKLRDACDLAAAYGAWPRVATRVAANVEVPKTVYGVRRLVDAPKAMAALDRFRDQLADEEVASLSSFVNSLD